MASAKQHKYKHPVESVSTKVVECDSLYECSICYSDAIQPVVLKCGHFYCWECIHKWLIGYASSQKLCPICKIRVDDNDIIPIYGKGKEGDFVTPRPAAPVQTSQSIGGNQSELPTESFDWENVLKMGIAAVAAAFGGFMLGKYTAKRGTLRSRFRFNCSLDGLYRILRMSNKNRTEEKGSNQ